MKISRENCYLNHINTIKSNNQSTANISQKKNTKNFDTITLSFKQTFDEAAFSKEISQKVLKEVYSAADNQNTKTENLKTQVQNGSYQIMVDEIAKKMLFF